MEIIQRNHFWTQFMEGPVKWLSAIPSVSPEISLINEVSFLYYGNTCKIQKLTDEFLIKIHLFINMSKMNTNLPKIRIFDFYRDS